MACLTAACLALTQAKLRADPHAEGVNAGRVANTTAGSTVNAPSAATVVPGYTTTPPERSHYRQPNLAAKGSARLAACALTPTDPVCQDQQGAVTSANTPRPYVGTDDPAVAAARAINRSPSMELGSLASYYSGCKTTVTTTPGGVKPQACLRHVGIGNYQCSSTLDVSVTRTTSCKPGDWVGHAEVDHYGLDVQCLPDRSVARQHFRVTRNGEALSFFDVDMSAPAVFPILAATLETSTGMQGQPIRTGLWVVENSCSGASCSLKAMVAPELIRTCTGGGDADITCTEAEPFLKVYGPCPSGTQSGGNIVNSTCQGDAGCSATSLDPNTCYAPSEEPTPLVGSDVTGSIPGIYWNLHSTRAVVGWLPNPAVGPIPTMLLTYDRATSSFVQADRWDDHCPPLAGDGRCTVASEPTCTDGPSTKTIDGVPVTRACWEQTRTMSCAGSTPPDQCASLAAAGCTFKTSTCRRTNAGTGACELFEDVYECATAPETVTTASNCPTNVYCLGTSCFDISAPKDPDFARTMSMLEATREAGVYLDADRMQVFKGEDNRCRDRLLKNCCYADGAGAGMNNQSIFGTGSRLVYDILMDSQNQQFIYQGLSALLMSGGFSGTFTSYGVTIAVNGAALPAGSVAVYSGESVVVAFDPWSLVIAIIIYIVLSMMSCNEPEGRLAMKEGAGLCHTVGTYCSSCLMVLGKCVSCVEHTTSKCCFNSKLARIVNEQGRAQVGKGWGMAGSPDCSGFTLAQLQRLDFAAMDLSEFYASLVPVLPDLGSLQGGNAARIPACYYGQGRCQ